MKDKLYPYLVYYMPLQSSESQFHGKQFVTWRHQIGPFHLYESKKGNKFLCDLPVIDRCCVCQYNTIKTTVCKKQKAQA